MPQAASGAVASAAFAAMLGATATPEFNLRPSGTKPVVRYGQTMLSPLRISRDPWLKRVVRTIEGFSELAPDWDSYGAARISSAAIEAANDLLTHVYELFSKLAGVNGKPFAVVPVPTGGVQIEWRTPEREIEVEIGPGGTLGYLSSSLRTSDQQEQSGVSMDAVLEAVAVAVIPKVSA